MVSTAANPPSMYLVRAGRAILAEVAYQKSHKRDLFQLHRYDNKLKKSSPYRATWWEQFRALMWRSFLSVIKEPLLIQVRFFQSIVS